jgi:hypothetical protein
MIGFRFEKHPAYNLPAERLKTIEKTLQNRVQAWCREDGIPFIEER